MKFPRISLLAALGLMTFMLSAEAVKDREGAVRKDREVMENDRRWIYNDWRHGFDVARQSGKPLLIVLRCVPCLACAGIDASVLSDSALAPLLDRFICVRVINANALDLSLFQVDFDLSFSTVFFNGDGTIYGRYGSWLHQKNAQEKATSGFRLALEGALQIHSQYPSNKSALVGKQCNDSAYRSTLDIPELNGKYKLELDWKGRVVPSCVHCHQIGDAIRAASVSKGETIPEKWLYPWPSPEVLGLTLAVDQAARIEAVAPKSPAEASGLRVGDDLVSINGQPIISSADVSWILHQAPAVFSLIAKAGRHGVEREVRVNLPEGWRTGTDISRRAGSWQLRGMATGGLLLEELDEAGRKERGIAADKLGLIVKHAGEYGKHAAAKMAGFQKEDILVEIDGSATRRSESQLLGELLTRHKPGDKIRARVMRGSSILEMAWPIQN